MTNLSIIRGDYTKLRLTVTSDGSAFDISSTTVSFTVKENVSDAMADALISKTVTSHVNASGGITDIVLLPADTDLGLKSYHYDCQVQTVDNKIYTVVRGLITVEYDITG